MKRVVASDIVSLSHCARRLWYDYNQPVEIGEIVLDPFEELMLEIGIEHERRVLADLSDKYEVLEAASLEHTLELMKAGTEVIYQGQLLDKTNQLFGQPDFMFRQEDGSYQAADAKSALSVKPEIGIQIAFYRRLLGSDASGIVYLGNGEIQTVDAELDAKLNSFVTEARAVLEHDRPLVRYSESKCNACPYQAACYPDFVAADELTLLYGVDSRSAPGLEAQGIATISDLAQADPDTIDDVPYLKGAKKERAVLQARALKTGEIFKLHDIDLPEGTYVHFDVEANPQTPDGHQHVYLWGFLVPPYGADNFDYVWSNSLDEEHDAWMAFLRKVEEFRETWPDVKLIHFAHYERDRIASYAKMYEMADHPTVAWLLDKEDGPLFDIQKPVTRNLVLPLSGYGLKNICKHPVLVNFQWEDEGSGSQWSVVQFINFLRSNEPEERQAIKEAILRYNRDDVIATRRLEEWLRGL